MTGFIKSNLVRDFLMELLLTPVVPPQKSSKCRKTKDYMKCQGVRNIYIRGTKNHNFIDINTISYKVQRQ